PRLPPALYTGGEQQRKRRPGAAAVAWWGSFLLQSILCRRNACSSRCCAAGVSPPAQCWRGWKPRHLAGCWRSSGVEQLICNQPVGGSIPSASSTLAAGRVAAGQVGEWLIPTDCKSVAPWGYGGSNPPLSTRSWLWK